MENHKQLTHILKLMGLDSISDTTSIGPNPPAEPKCVKGRIIVKNTWWWAKKNGEKLGEAIGLIAVCEHQAYHPPSSPAHNLERRRKISDWRYNLLEGAISKALRCNVNLQGSCTFCLTDFAVHIWPFGVMVTSWKDLGGVPRLDGRSVYQTEGSMIVCELFERNVGRLDEDDVSVYGWAYGSPYTVDDLFSGAEEGSKSTDECSDEEYCSAQEYFDEGYGSAKEHLKEDEADKDLDGAHQ